MSLSTLVLLSSLALSTGMGQTATKDVFAHIDDRYERGLIDAETRQLYRVAVVRRPELLPPALSALARSPRGAVRRSLTPIFMEAMGWVRENQAQGGAVHNLLMPPDDLGLVLESSTHDIRVSYSTTAQQSLAQWSLDYAEIAWDVLTQQYGFWVPPIEPGAERYRIYITSTNGHGAAYTSPYDENPDTPNTDYYTYIVVDPLANSEWDIAGTMAHELNHATQAAMDVLEPTGFWENTATYIMSRVFVDQLYFTVATMYLFQGQPWRALDYMNTQTSDSYEYGGGLFVWYLADTYAPNEPPQFVAEIWQRCVQNNWVNEPDYFDAIEQTVAARGFDHSMEEILLDFSEARFFVGNDDDGAHITNAYQFDGAEVALTAHHVASQLPVRFGVPPTDRLPAAFGSNHVLVGLPPDYTRPISVHFDGDDDTRWGARVVLFGGGQPTVATPLPLVAEAWDATVVVEPSGHEGLLLVVANQGEAGYDPDIYDIYRPWPVSSYLYDIEPVMDPPSNMALIPDVLERGQQGVFVELTGSGFEAGGEFDLAFLDSHIHVDSIDRVLSGAVSFRITVPLITDLGPKDLVVTNRDGQQATATGVLTVVERGSIAPDGGPGTDDSPRGGCGCRAGGAPPPVGLWLVLLGLAGWRWRRRGR